MGCSLFVTASSTPSASSSHCATSSRLNTTWLFLVKKEAGSTILWTMVPLFSLTSCSWLSFTKSTKALSRCALNTPVSVFSDPTSALGWKNLRKAVDQDVPMLD
ncbi:hypothetical protein WMY93_010729 [Mugilogobius chulae]|uniref:Secreted protein n=1 Tax=Mugilogobius chulae TaxID=88201 RepID=A0AAW0P8H8_9GOBI